MREVGEDLAVGDWVEEEGEDPHLADAFTPEVLARLRAIKRRHDTQYLFRANFPVGV